MDYEKKYKEALERAKTELNSPDKGLIEYIFPELAESEDEKIRKEIICFLRNIPNSNYTCEEMAAWLEKQGEQRHVDKKTKFKVGDILVNENGYTRRVVDIKDDCYYCTREECCDDYPWYGVIPYVDRYWHKWTIQDAKDGDVLATQDSIFIFKHIDKTGRSFCKSYCEVIGNSGLGLGFIFSINGVYTATKEQHDLLFQKMKEAGYEWDADKKELKKL